MIINDSPALFDPALFWGVVLFILFCFSLCGFYKNKRPRPARLSTTTDNPLHNLHIPVHLISILIEAGAARSHRHSAALPLLMHSAFSGCGPDATALGPVV
jgi:hypothetical protein